MAQARRDIGDAVGLQPFKDYVRRTYGEVDEATVRAFLRKGEDTQLIGPPPRSEGKAVALSHKDSWYVDLLSLPKGDPDYKLIMTVQNAYTGYLYAQPLVSTSPSGENGTAAIFERMLEQSRLDGQGPPQTITTDGSNVEWSREFQDVLRRHGIIHRVKEPRDANLMGKLDATQQRLRALLRVKLDGSGEQSWSRRLPGVVDNYNNRLRARGLVG